METGFTLEGMHKDRTVLFGFWIYLMTDLVLFASLFAEYAVMRNATFGLARPPFDLQNAFIESIVLLCSSLACGFSLLAARKNQKGGVIAWLCATFVLGAAFLWLELSEFASLFKMGDAPGASGFLSSYCALVGTHGLHIVVGLLWLIALLIAIGKNGLKRSNLRKLLLWSFFWHFLDMVWIFIFTVVYLFGALS